MLRPFTASRAVRLVLGAALATPLLAGCGSDDPPGTSTDATVGGALASVVDDARRMAPALESVVRGTAYPTSLVEAREVLADAGIEPSDGNLVNGYEYDPETVEFVLCIEAATGAFASYDTRPMSLFTTGESGGCPVP